MIFQVLKTKFHKGTEKKTHVFVIIWNILEQNKWRIKYFESNSQVFVIWYEKSLQKSQKRIKIMEFRI